MSRLVLRTAQPTEDETLLLQAALLDGDNALAAYRSWLAVRDPRSVDFHSRGFLPALSRNLQRLGVTDEHTPYLREEWLRSMATNTQLLKAAARAVAVLDRAGLPTVLIKGAALIADRAVSDPGSRLLGDADVLVPKTTAHTAAAALKDAGWVLVGGRSFEDERLRGHSTSFMDARRSQLDLHWGATFEPSDDAPVFRRAVPATLAGTATSVPDPADQVVLACLHGSGWHCTRLRWIADVTWIVRRHPELDWDLVSAEAQRRAAAHQIATQLEMLRSITGAPVPDSVISTLRRDRLTVTERVLQRAKESPHWGTAIYLCSWDHARRARALPEPVAEPYMTFALLDLGLRRRRELVWRLISSPVRHLYWLAVGRRTSA